MESQREKGETKMIPRLQDWTVIAPFIIKENTEEKIIKKHPQLWIHFEHFVTEASLDRAVPWAAPGTLRRAVRAGGRCRHL